MIGRATGELLQAHGHQVTYNDVNAEIMKELKSKGKNIDFNVQNPYDVYWICTAEWNVDDVLRALKQVRKTDPWVVIRSTIRPGELKRYAEKYKIEHIAHIPEFLRQKTAIEDIFDADRIIIGTNDEELAAALCHVFKGCIDERVIICSPDEAALAKLIANAWLAMQISFWNEMKALASAHEGVNPQMVANMVTADRRISKYGSNMLGVPFKGFCFPKDTRSLKEVFRDNGVPEHMISALITTNEEMM